jgi:hypothetical protein
MASVLCRLLSPANAVLAGDDPPDSQTHCAPAQTSCTKQFGADLVDRSGPHSRLTPGDPDVIDPQESSQLDGQ